MVALQFPQLLREHLGSGLRDQLVQFPVAQGAANQVPQDEGLVLAANQAQGRVHRAVETRTVAAHGRSPCTVSFWVVWHLKVRTCKKEIL